MIEIQTEARLQELLTDSNWGRDGAGLTSGPGRSQRSPEGNLAFRFNERFISCYD